MNTAYKLQGINRHYDWGGQAFIPNLLGIDNITGKPFAEYWMGAHPAAASLIEYNNVPTPIDQFLEAEAASKIPYLFKVLDVASMLSIQVHPNKTNAEIGFAKETAAGIPIDAFNRNYKDANHKPEMMVALSDFWLLHGFLSPQKLIDQLHKYPDLASLLPYFEGANYLGLYHYVMHLSNDAADAILKPLVAEAIQMAKEGKLTKADPHWWTNKYYNGLLPETTIDKGIFSIYILNIVYVPPYAGVFQGAGLLHAYLEGQNIELMSNSDNVLRGGLTPKHIAIEELMQHVQFIPTIPNILAGEKINDYETIYPCPVADFGLSNIQLQNGNNYTIYPKAIEMLLVMEGAILIGQMEFKRGEVAILLGGTTVEIVAKDNTKIFKSFVP